MADFLALGNLTLDDVVTSDGRVAPAQLGGNGVYAAVGMHVWGVHIALVGVVGQNFPQHWLDALADANIDLSGVSRLDMPHQLRSRAFYFPDGRRTDRVEEARGILPRGIEAVLDLVSEYADMGSPLHRRYWPLFSPTPALMGQQHTQARCAHLAPGPLANNRANAHYLKTHTNGRMQLSLDWPWWDWDQETVADRELLGHIDFLLPSREELQIHGRSLPESALADLAQSLLVEGPRAIVVKQGSQGAKLFVTDQPGWKEIPVYPTLAADPTGAGDAFCGGFMVGIARTEDPFQAALYGAVSASFIIQDFGALHALEVTPSQAEQRLQTLREHVAGRDAFSQPRYHQTKEHDSS